MLISDYAGFCLLLVQVRMYKNKKNSDIHDAAILMCYWASN